MAINPRPFTESHGVALDAATGATIRRDENGRWITNAEWIALYAEGDDYEGPGRA